MHVQAPQIEQSSTQAKGRHNQVPDDYETESRIFKAIYLTTSDLIQCQTCNGGLHASWKGIEQTRRSCTTTPNIDQGRRRNINLPHELAGGLAEHSLEC